MKLIGDINQYEIIINPSKNQFEAAGIDRFNILLKTYIGDLQEIVISKKISQKFFQDWYLDKVLI